MSQQICLECGERFEPSRSSQRYCSPRCSRRCREHRRLRKEHASALAHIRERLNAAHADGRAHVAATEAEFRKRLKQQTDEAAHRLAREISEREQTIEQLHTRLRQLAAENIDLSGEMSEMKANASELRKEMARRADTAATDQHDLVQLGGRLLDLTIRFEIPLDTGATAIFRRRGWMLPTRAPAR